MKKNLTLILIAFSLLFCKEKHLYENKSNIDIKVETLDSVETRFFSGMDCEILEGIAVKRVLVTNNSYDTLRLWVRDYCSTDRPFLLIDAVREYVNGSENSVDLIFTKTGYTFDVLKHETKIVYNCSKPFKKNVKHRYTFWAEIDSFGTKTGRDLYFFDPDSIIFDKE